MPLAYLLSAATSTAWKTISKRLLGFILFFLFSGDLVAADKGLQFSRENFGSADYGVWSELTGFERATLNQQARIRAGDGDALLAFFLLASGDVRHQSDFNRYRKRIDDWLRTLEAELRAIETEKERARFIYRSMHKEFFLPQAANDELAPGYRLEQSKLSDVFESRKFNCISSSLLYMVAAHKSGLRTKGVLLPSHSFVEVHLQNGETIEVETTSLHGFDLVHDEAFYEPQQEQWFIDRELEPLTYSQYLDREVIAPFKLGLYNIWSQHTSPERMNYRDRMRLAEIRAVFWPEDVTVQKTRLSFYNQEFNYLHDRGDYATLARLFSHIAPLLQNLEQGLASQTNDLELANLLAWLNSQHALTLINTGQGLEGIALVKRYLKNLSPELPDYRRIQENLYLILANYLHARSDEEEFSQAQVAVAGFESLCLHNAACANGLAGLYASWGKHYWQQEEWEQAIGIYHQYLNWDNSSNYVEVFRSNSEKAHLNWARQALQDKNWEAADKILERCTISVSEARQCESHLHDLREQATDEM